MWVIRCAASLEHRGSRDVFEFLAEVREWPGRWIPLSGGGRCVAAF